jgi:hypothetical protein
MAAGSTAAAFMAAVAAFMVAVAAFTAAVAADTIASRLRWMADCRFV